jgi:hypothetical protein
MSKSIHYFYNLSTTFQNIFSETYAYVSWFNLFSSAQGELLVSKGDTPASVVRRHASTIVLDDHQNLSLAFLGSLFSS